MPTFPRPNTWLVYSVFDGAGVLLYVGKTNSIKVRLDKHAAEQPWWCEVAGYMWVVHPDEVSALAAEKAKILRDQPKYNKRSRDGSAMPMFACRLPRGLVRETRAMATQDGVSVSAAVRDLLAAGLALRATATRVPDDLARSRRGF